MHNTVNGLRIQSYGSQLESFTAKLRSISGQLLMLHQEAQTLSKINVAQNISQQLDNIVVIDSQGKELQPSEHTPIPELDSLSIRQVKLAIQALQVFVQVVDTAYVKQESSDINLVDALYSVINL